MTSDACPSRSRAAWWRHAAFAAAMLFMTCSGLVVTELAVRYCCPSINYQDTDANLLVRHPQDGYRWRPGTAGFCFGEHVQIDATGCRDLAYPKAAQEHWLVLGDSVAFGVGVPAAETLAGRVERALPQVHLRNASVVGMNLDGQLAVAREMLEHDSAIRRVTLFYCLNDLEDVAGEVDKRASCEPAGINDLSPTESTMSERVRGLLRSRSKLYLLLKGSLADRSQTYFWCDYARYRPTGGATPVGLDRLEALGELAARHRVAFEVVLLPYEYQLRAKNEDLWEPQRQVAAYLADRGIRCHDARSWLEAGGDDSRAWYLYGDPMHLSSAGHRQIASHWLRSMRETAPQQPAMLARPSGEPTESTQ